MYVRVARFHNVYGPHGTWDGGREKAPAAICRKVIQAKVSGKHEIEIWGDGSRRAASCISTTAYRASRKSWIAISWTPINLGSTEMVTINQLVDIVEDIAGIKLKRIYDLDAPKGVNGPQQRQYPDQEIPGLGTGHFLAAGLEKTYAWIYDQYMARENKQAYVL